MIYRFITATESGLEQMEIEARSVQIAIARASVEGLECTALNDNPRQREELQGQPKFKGYHGPMWDRTAIRYECAKAYERLSA
jgi:hypothetical protein